MDSESGSAMSSDSNSLVMSAASNWEAVLGHMKSIKSSYKKIDSAQKNVIDELIQVSNKQKESISERDSIIMSKDSEISRLRRQITGAIIGKSSEVDLEMDSFANDMRVIIANNKSVAGNIMARQREEIDSLLNINRESERRILKLSEELQIHKIEFLVELTASQHADDHQAHKSKEKEFDAEESRKVESSCDADASIIVNLRAQLSASEMVIFDTMKKVERYQKIAAEASKNEAELRGQVDIMSSSIKGVFQQLETLSKEIEHEREFNEIIIENGLSSVAKPIQEHLVILESEICKLQIEVNKQSSSGVPVSSDSPANSSPPVNSKSSVKHLIGSFENETSKRELESKSLRRQTDAAAIKALAAALKDAHFDSELTGIYVEHFDKVCRAAVLAIVTLRRDFLNSENELEHSRQEISDINNKLSRLFELENEYLRNDKGGSLISVIEMIKNLLHANEQMTQSRNMAVSELSIEHEGKKKAEMDLARVSADRNDLSDQFQLVISQLEATKVSSNADCLALKDQLSQLNTQLAKKDISISDLKRQLLDAEDNNNLLLASINTLENEKISLSEKIQNAKNGLQEEISRESTLQVLANQLQTDLNSEKSSVDALKLQVIQLQLAELKVSNLLNHEIELELSLQQQLLLINEKLCIVSKERDSLEIQLQEAKLVEEDALRTIADAKNNSEDSLSSYHTEMSQILSQKDAELQRSREELLFSQSEYGRLESQLRSTESSLNSDLEALYRKIEVDNVNIEMKQQSELLQLKSQFENEIETLKVSYESRLEKERIRSASAVPVDEIGTLKNRIVILEAEMAGYEVRTEIAREDTAKWQGKFQAEEKHRKIIELDREKESMARFKEVRALERKVSEAKSRLVSAEGDMDRLSLMWSKGEKERGIGELKVSEEVAALRLSLMNMCSKWNEYETNTNGHIQNLESQLQMYKVNPSTMDDTMMGDLLLLKSARVGVAESRLEALAEQIRRKERELSGSLAETEDSYVVTMVDINAFLEFAMAVIEGTESSLLRDRIKNLNEQISNLQSRIPTESNEVRGASAVLVSSLESRIELLERENKALTDDIQRRYKSERDLVSTLRTISESGDGIVDNSSTDGSVHNMILTVVNDLRSELYLLIEASTASETERNQLSVELQQERKVRQHLENLIGVQHAKDTIDRINEEVDVIAAYASAISAIDQATEIASVWDSRSDEEVALDYRDLTQLRLVPGMLGDYLGELRRRCSQIRKEEREAARVEFQAGSAALLDKSIKSETELKEENQMRSQLEDERDELLKQLQTMRESLQEMSKDVRRESEKREIAEANLMRALDNLEESNSQLRDIRLQKKEIEFEVDKELRHQLEMQVQILSTKLDSMESDLTHATFASEDSRKLANVERERRLRMMGELKQRVDESSKAKSITENLRGEVLCAWGSAGEYTSSVGKLLSQVEELLETAGTFDFILEEEVLTRQSLALFTPDRTLIDDPVPYISTGATSIDMIKIATGAVESMLAVLRGMDEFRDCWSKIRLQIMQEVANQEEAFLSKFIRQWGAIEKGVSRQVAEARSERDDWRRKHEDTKKWFEDYNAQRNAEVMTAFDFLTSLINSINRDGESLITMLRITQARVVSEEAERADIINQLVVAFLEMEADYSQNLTSLTDRFENLLQENERLKITKSQVDSELEDLRKKYSQLRELYTSQASVVESLRNELATCQSSLCKSLDDINQLNALVNALEKKICKLESDLSKERNDKDSVLKEFEALKVEMVALRASCNKEIEKCRAECAAEIKDIQQNHVNEIQELKRGYQDTMASMEKEFEEELEALRRMKDEELQALRKAKDEELKTLNNKLDNTCRQYDAIIAGLKSDIESANAESYRLKLEYESLSRDKEDVDRLLASAMSDLGKSKDRIQELERIINENSNSLTDLQTRLAAALLHIERLSDSLHGMTVERDALEMEMQELSRELTDFKAEAELNAQSNADMLDENSRQITRLTERLNAAVMERDSTNSECERLLSKLQSSTRESSGPLTPRGSRRTDSLNNAEMDSLRKQNELLLRELHFAMDEGCRMISALEEQRVLSVRAVGDVVCKIMESISHNNEVVVSYFSHDGLDAQKIIDKLASPLDHHHGR